MKLNDMIIKLTNIKNKYGDMRVVIHDSADGSDYIGMSIYRDPGDDEMPDECVIGFDSDYDIR